MVSLGEYTVNARGDPNVFVAGDPEQLSLLFKVIYFTVGYRGISKCNFISTPELPFSLCAEETPVR